MNTQVTRLDTRSDRSIAKTTAPQTARRGLPDSRADHRAFRSMFPLHAS